MGPISPLSAPDPSLHHALRLPEAAIVEPTAGPAPVTLPADRILPIPEGGESNHSRDVLEADRPRDRLLEEKPPLFGTASHEDSHRSESEELRDRIAGAQERADLQRRNHAVTYRVHPDLERHLQGNVIDRDTSEVLLSIPSEERIQLMKSIREFLGVSLDTRA